MSKYIIILIGLLFLIACDSKSPKQNTVDNYSIIVEYPETADLDILSDSLRKIINDTLIVFDVSLKIGLFDSYRKACDRGFELFADSMIPNFNVVFRDSVLSNDYTPLYFVGKYLDRPGLYKFDIISKEPELIWSNWGRKILFLYRNDKRDNFFFNTTLHETIRGSFPLIMDTRLYHFERSNERVSLINKVGNVMNVKGSWDSDSIYTTFFTVLDSMITSNIIQHQYNYNGDGSIIDSTERIYELISDGIPIPNFPKINPISPDHRYKMVTVRSDSVEELNIIDELDGTNNIITQLNGDIIETKWNDTNDFLFLTTNSSPDTTNLLIVDLKKMELINIFSGSGEKNFLIIGNLLIFDDGYDFDSYITLYSYRKNKIYSEIKIAGGCGVNSIPKKAKIF